ncbi:MAG TPA: copper resistance protein B [Alphaproteobacteria bacterium]|nr:copper resistance protein B [Alphaproteobacteria bacterium]
MRPFPLACLIVFAPTDAAQAQMSMPPMEENRIFIHGVLEQFEGRVDGRAGAFRWDGQAWIGGDYDKLRIKSEGIVESDGRVGDGDHEILYDRAISTYFDLEAGLRSDIDSRPTRNWAAFGVEGLAPLFFDVAATAYVSGQGHFAARLQASYDLLITQRLILQPEAELNLYSKSDPARRIGAGFSDIDTGLRLRYEITRKFAPYVGLAYQGTFGETSNFAQHAGESTGAIRFVFGIRSWF